MSRDRQEFSLEEHQVVEVLGALKEGLPRDPAMAAAGKQVFLEQAKYYRQAVSPRAFTRHSWWNKFILLWKERKPMTTLISLIIAAVLVMSGTGATIAASQTSLPDEPLYGLKLASEEARLGMTVNAQERLSLMLAFSDRRMDEAVKAIKGGEEISPRVQARWEQHIEAAFQLAGGMENGDKITAMAKIRERLQNQVRLLSQLKGEPKSGVIMLMLQTRLQERLQQSGSDAGVPQGEQKQQRSGGDGEATGGNPWTDEMPDPKNSYGPGPGDGDCTGPAECPQPKDGEEWRQPWTDEAPQQGSGDGPASGDGSGSKAPGSGAGPQTGPGPNETDCQNCAPKQDGTGSGGSGSGGSDSGQGGGKKP